MSDSEEAYDLAKRHGIEITGNKSAGYMLVYPDGSGMFWDEEQRTFASPGDLLPHLRQYDDRHPLDEDIKPSS